MPIHGVFLPLLGTAQKSPFFAIRLAPVEHETEQRKRQSLGDPREYRGTLRDLHAHGGQLEAPPYPAFRKGGWAGSVQRGEVRAGSDEVRVQKHLR